MNLNTNKKTINLIPFNLLQLNKNRNILKRALETWGSAAQIEMIIEECLELALALQQAKRASKDPKEMECKILDEIADVTIMISQAWLLFPEDRLRQRVAFKMDRLNKTLDKLENGKKPIQNEGTDPDQE